MLDDLPEDLGIDVPILMTDAIADATNILPRQLGAAAQNGVGEVPDSLRNGQQCSLGGGTTDEIPLEFLERQVARSHPCKINRTENV